MKTLNIAILCHAGLGGSGILGTTLAIRLSERGHQVHLIASSRPFGLQNPPPNLRFHEVKVPNSELLTHPPEAMAITGKLERLARKVKFDIIHSHFAVPFALSAEVVRQSSEIEAKLVVTLHGTDVTLMGREVDLRPSIKWALRRADAVTAVSNSLRDEALQRFGNDLNIRTIYNFLVDPLPKLTEQEKMQRRQELGLDKEDFILVHASNFRTVKRIDDIIDAFYRTLLTHRAKLVMFGDGPLRQNAIDLCGYMKIDDHVRFPGKVKECARWLGMGDLLLQLSIQESFGLVFLEGFSQGIPAVATRVGGIPEVVTEGHNGLLCEAVNPIDAARKIRHLIGNPQEYARLAANTEPTLQQFDQQTIIEEYENLYLELLSN